MVCHKQANNINTPKMPIKISLVTRAHVLP
jgi:hypothetical protein